MDSPALPEGYSTRPHRVELDGCSIGLTLISNLDELLDELLAKGADHEDVRDERIPYWAELWPSALALGRHLIRAGRVQPGAQVLEIGCGLGLPGIVAGMLGAEVTFTDYLPDALDFARHNWAQNLGRPAQFRLLDWRAPEPELAADIVLASDVAYEKRAFPHLPNAFRTLCRPGGIILASDPCRSSAGEFYDHILPKEGFRVQAFPSQEIFNGHPFNIRVYEIALAR